jgi:RNA polymerase sigma-70 factor, ECF subfamily
MPQESDLDARDTAEATARRSYGKLVAFLAARTGDVAGAEDALSDAFAAALVDWPARGVPASPEAWLMTAARRKLIDAARRRRTSEAAAGQLRLMVEELAATADAETEIPDDRLRLMFACVHPAIEPGIRAPLILQTVLGFDAAAIASAFLVSPTTMGQRLVRAKHKIRQAGVPLRVPERVDLRERLDAVLESIYAVYAEGWSDPAGTEARARNLAEEAIWLGRLVVSLLPDEPEGLGLLALMLHAEARRRARRDFRGDYVPLTDQDPASWDEGLIEEAEGLLARASARGEVGRFQLEAAVQSAHVVRRRTGRSDWSAIERLYDALLALTGSPVVALNRAIAVAETRGPEEGLAALGALADDARLSEYQPYWAARAGLLARTGQVDAADRAYELAIGLEPDGAVRRFLQDRRSALRDFRGNSDGVTR